jgi:hypothetical protein
MKKNYVILALFLVAAMVFPTMVGAQGDTLPGSGWWTGQQIQNVGTANATVVSTAYDSLSPNTYTASFFPLAAGSSVTFLPADFAGMGPGFQGSAVVSADQPIKAIVSLTNRQVGSYGVPGGVAGGQYQGIDGTAAATTVRFPIVKNAFGGGSNIKTTTFFVQNAGSAAATISIQYICPTVYNYTTPNPIGPGQMAVLNPAAAGVPAGNLCSGTATSAQPIAGVATEHYNSETVATLVQATRGFTSADYDTTIYAPIFKKRFPTSATRSRTTGGQVQNVSAANINVTGTFRGTGACLGPFVVTVNNVAPGASANFLYPAGMPDGCLTSGTFTATGNIVGIVNESYLDPAPLPGTQSATAYNMASDLSKTVKAVAPLFKEQFGGKTSGLQAQNVGASNATMYVVFKSGANTWTTINYVVTPGASANFYLMANCGVGCWVGGIPMPAGTNASATVNSDQPVIAAIAEQAYTVANPNCFGQTSGPCYDKQNYEGFNVAP